MSRPIAAGLAVLAAGVAAVFIPWLTERRPVTAATPTPPPLFDPAFVRLGARDIACAGPVVLTPETEVVRVLPARETGPRLLAVDVTAGDYVGQGVEVGGARGEPWDVVLQPPPPATFETKVCVRNPEGAPIRVAATAEPRSTGRATTELNGLPLDRNVVLLFFERGRASIASRLPELFDRAATWWPDPLGAWTLWLLAPLVLVGLPAGTLWALHRALRADREG